MAKSIDLDAQRFDFSTIQDISQSDNDGDPQKDEEDINLFKKKFPMKNALMMLSYRNASKPLVC
jgi:hypothetical protein